MNVSVTINLGANEYAADLAGNATELAEKILVAIGGDESKDMVNVMISDAGSAGATSMLPPVIPPISEPIPETVNSTFTTTNSPPPGDKQIRTNMAAESDVTAVYVDNETTEGVDISIKLLALVIGDVIEIRGVTDPARFAKFTLSAIPVNQSGFVELPVVFTETGTALANGACTLTFPVRS